MTNITLRWAFDGGGIVKAMVQDVYGCADVLRSDDIPQPEPRTGDVLIRVAAAGVGPDVWHVMTGLPYILRAGTGPRRRGTVSSAETSRAVSSWLAPV